MRGLDKPNSADSTGEERTSKGTRRSIDRKRVVRYVRAGYHDGEELNVEKEIKELLAE
jgi:hypothetical protein